MLDAGSVVFAKYEQERHFTQDELEKLSPEQKANLNSVVLRGLFEEKLFTYGQVLNLDSARRHVFETDRNVVEQFRRGRKLLSESKSEESALQKYLNEGSITLAAYAELKEKLAKVQQEVDGLERQHAKLRQQQDGKEKEDAISRNNAEREPAAAQKTQVENQLENLNSEPVRMLFEKGRLTFEQVLNLDANQRYAIEKAPEIFAQVYDGQLSLRFVTAPIVQKYVSDGQLTEEQFEKLSPKQKFYVSSRELRELFEARCATFDEIRDLSEEQWAALKNADTVKQIKEGQLPFKLCGHSAGIRSLVAAGRLSKDEVLALTVNQRHILETKDEVREQFRAGKLLLSLIEYPVLQGYIDGELLTEKEIGEFSAEHKLYLNTSNVFDLVHAKLLTVQQALKLTHEQWQGIKNDPSIVDNFRQKTVMLIDGRLMRANSAAAPKAAMHAPAPAGAGAARHDDAAAAVVRQNKSK